MRKTTPLLVQLDGQSLGDVTVSIDESKITPELTKLNTTVSTISTTTKSSNSVLGTVTSQLTAKNSAKEDKTIAQSAIDACAKLESIEKSTSATAQSLVDNPAAPAADQVKVGAAVKRIRDTIGQTTDADTENTTIGLLKKIKANTEGTGTITGTVAIKADQFATLATETTLGTRASETTVAKLGTEATLSTRATEATLALVSKDATTQSLKALVGTADDAAGTNTVIGLLKEIYMKNVPSCSIGTIAACNTVPGLTTWTTYDPITQDIQITAGYHYIILQEQNKEIQLAIFSAHGSGILPKGAPSSYWPARWNTTQHIISFPSQPLGNTQPNFILYNTENKPVIKLTAKINYAYNDTSVVSLFYTGSIANTLTIKT